MTTAMHGRRRGFTLIELVVSLAITGMVAATGAFAFNTVVDMRTRARDVTAMANAAASNRALLVAWLSSGRVSIGGGNASTASLRFSDDDDQVVVIATASTPLNYGEVAVRLFIDRDELTPEKGLVAEVQEIGGTLRRTRVQLDSVVSGLVAEFLDNTTGMWLTRRNGLPRSPRAVRVTFSADAPDTLPALLRLPFVQTLVATTNTSTNTGQQQGTGTGR